jgi:cysteine desulfurase
MSELIYLDNNATTLVADEVLEAMEPYYREWFGNAHSAYSLGRRSHDAVEAARAEVAMLLGTAPAEVIFTSCGTEGNAIVIRGLADTAKQRRKMVTTAVEHPSVMLLLRALEAAGQIDLAVIPVSDEGAIDLDDVRNAVDDKTLLVSVMLAQNETGVILPVAGIAAIAHQRGALVHVDAVQSAAKIAVDANALGTDFITISGHKFHAPKGVGALTIRRGIRLPPLWYGGGQELGMRSGTEPVPSLVGFGVAARLARERFNEFERVRTLRNRLEQTLLSTIEKVSINGGSQPRLPNTSSVAFHNVAADELLRAFDEEGLCASAGAACHSGKIEPSATLRAMRKPLHVAMGTIRFSLSRYTTGDEIDRAIAIAQRIVPEMRRASIGSS